LRAPVHELTVDHEELEVTSCAQLVSRRPGRGQSRVSHELPGGGRLSNRLSNYKPCWALMRATDRGQRAEFN
jgi:hypothetical protein